MVIIISAFLPFQPNEKVVQQSSDVTERTVAYCISLPGQNEWVTQVSRVVSGGRGYDYHAEG